jgi:hypothetical protein
MGNGMDRADERVAVRRKLAEIVMQAEEDEDFQRRLRRDPAALLEEYGVPVSAVDELSAEIDVAMHEPNGDPTDCIHTNGCNDFTCIISRCSPTCYVTIKIDPPDA